MAARQDQTLQIFLIIFIFLFLIAAVLAYLGWRGYSDEFQRATTLDTKAKEKEQQVLTQQSELENLRERIGFGRNDNTPDVLKASEDELTNTYGKGIDEPTYRKVLQSVHTELQATGAREAKLKLDLAARDKQLLAKETETKKMIDQHDAARKSAEERLAVESSKFAEDRKALEKAGDDLKKSLQDQRAKYEGDIASRDATIKNLTTENTKLAQANKNLIDQRKDEPGSFEVADGRISWVNQNGTVWINLGSADFLRRQVTFSVFDADLHDAAKSEKKGSIEVTRILGDHMAEARITDDDPTNPILTGDKIYSQIWHRGKQLHFAFTGVIDIDGDTQSDLDLARELVKLNGGVVDAYLDNDGKVQGVITPTTRYLVAGDMPSSAAKAALTDGSNLMYKEAASMGVETITLPEFLSQMGYKPQDRTVRLGAGASARDFPATFQNDVSGRRASQFRERPPAVQDPLPSEEP
jgi:hypothetical protein